MVVEPSSGVLVGAGMELKTRGGGLGKKGGEKGLGLRGGGMNLTSSLGLYKCLDLIKKQRGSRA